MTVKTRGHQDHSILDRRAWFGDGDLPTWRAPELRGQLLADVCSQEIPLHEIASAAGYTERVRDSGQDQSFSQGVLLVPSSISMDCVLW